MARARAGNHTRRGRALAVTATALAATIGLASPAWADPFGGHHPFLSRLGAPSVVASTVPAASTPPQAGDGDQNPYGVALVPHSEGRLVGGDVLVSNFNDAANEQGTGRTIVEVSPQGSVSVFARIPNLPGGVGLTTALAVLPDGFVVVGSLPTSDGTSATAGPGGLLIVDRNGNLVENLTGGDINGPWDLTAQSFGDFAVLYVTNVLNGTVGAGGSVVDQGTVVRLLLDFRSGQPQVLNNTVIASGFAERTDPVALVVGPTGVGLGRDGTLYVADTVNSAIRAIPDASFRTTSAGTGELVSSGGALNGPLGLTVARNGDIISVNGGDGNAVETTPEGTQVATKLLDSTGNPPGNGALFGLAIAPFHGGLYYVDDDTNTLDRLPIAAPNFGHGDHGQSD
jgi:sugar lactone lactonase YvrE